jgi:signal peptidase I
MGKFRSLLWFVASILLAVYVIFGHKYKIIYNIGQSMTPSYSHKEFLILERAPSEKDWAPDRFDVVVFSTVGWEKLTKRVIGLPGDTIEIREGYIYLNNKKLSEYCIFGKGRISYTLMDDKAPLLVPKGHFWAIGDNRPISWHGLGKIENIIGVSLF